MKSKFTVLLFLALLFCSCNSKKGQVVYFDSGTTLDKATATELFTPFELEKFLGSSEEYYGSPKELVDLGDRAWAEEYIGANGRVRSCHQSYKGEYGWTTDYWAELYPGKLYLDEVLRPEKIDSVAVPEGVWNLLLRPKDGAWDLMLSLDGRAVTKVHYSRN